MQLQNRLRIGVCSVVHPEGVRSLHDVRPAQVQNPTPDHPIYSLHPDLLAQEEVRESSSGSIFVLGQLDHDFDQLRGGEIRGIVILLLFGNSCRKGRVNPEPRARGASTIVVPRANLLTATGIGSLGRAFGRVNDVKVEKCMGL